jgi:sigma-B regulation protein RsbU (phosphoserine phosphatase)
VGIFDGVAFEEDTLQLASGDALVMFTDGVTEALSPELEEFGTERLRTILAGQAGKSSRQVIETVRTAIKDFAGDAEQSDDITMLVIKRK